MGSLVGLVLAVPLAFWDNFADLPPAERWVSLDTGVFPGQLWCVPLFTHIFDSRLSMLSALLWVLSVGNQRRQSHKHDSFVN